MMHEDSDWTIRPVCPTPSPLSRRKNPLPDKKKDKDKAKKKRKPDYKHVDEYV